MICTFCKREHDTYFEVTPKNAAGENRLPSVQICSTICLVRWASAFSAYRGAQFVKTVGAFPAMAKSMISEAISQITRGPR